MQSSPNTQRWQYIFALIMMFVFGFYVAKNLPESSTALVTDTPVATPVAATDDAELAIPNIAKVWNMLNQKFIDPKKLDLEKMNDEALKGFVAGIGDHYTLYMTPDESKEFDIDLNGSLEGIGLVLESKDGVITVVSAIRESPAAKAGFKPNDVVYKIDGVSTENTSLLDAVKKIRGKAGTKVTVSVLRKGEAKPLDFTMAREAIHIDSVTLEHKDDIFHVIINQFNDTTQNQFNEVVQKALLEKPRGMIIDVRGNGGGYLDTAISIIGEFFKKGAVESIIKTRDPKNNKIYTAESDGRLTDIPVVVLIDGGSASASEILAGAFQDQKRGILIGEKSFGKGSVQELQQISNGGILRMTIAKWYTPNDHNIDETGIKPDIEIKMPDGKDPTTAKSDPQLDEALKYLKK